jgi:hypothetical protein
MGVGSMDRSFVLMEVLYSNFLLKEVTIQEFSKRWHRRWTSFPFFTFYGYAKRELVVG